MIRPARPTDRERVLELWLELIDYHRKLRPDVPRASGLRVAAAAEIARALDRDSCCLVVAEAGGRVEGFLLAEVEPAPTGASVEAARSWIHELWVAPEQRRRGVASALVDAADAFFRERGAARVAVRVESGNEDGLGFWRARRFVESARVLERLDP